MFISSAFQNFIIGVQLTQSLREQLNNNNNNYNNSNKNSGNPPSAEIKSAFQKLKPKF